MELLFDIGIEVDIIGLDDLLFSLDLIKIGDVLNDEVEAGEFKSGSDSNWAIEDEEEELFCWWW